MSRSIRLHVAATLASGTAIATTRAQAHYLGTVMRLRVGAVVLLFNGRDGEFSARIEAIAHGGATLRVEQPTRGSEAEPDVWLAFALLKRDATDLVVQKATELGVAEMHPVVTDHSNNHRMNAERLSAIATEAAEQSERLTVPRLHAPRPIAELLADWPARRRLFAAIERSGASPIATTAGPRALLVGPEGGFSPAELDALLAHPLVIPASLGPRILRAETACIAGLALLQAADCR